MFHNATEIIEVIEKRKNKGYGFQHFKEYMQALGNPQEKLSSLHVAGTNGKGSTISYLRSVLCEAGYQVATFTSPYLITHLDRIRINDKYISEEDFVRISNQNYESWVAWDLSMFEIDMCIATLYFLDQKVDYCIFEVGIGGRLDATNIITPIVSVITNIGMDHMELLGDTFEQIAEEKAGIIKRKVDVITSETKAECLAVFKRHAQETKSTCHIVQKIENVHLADTILFSYKTYKDIAIASLGAYQSKNAALAIEVLDYLVAKGSVPISEDQLRRGLKKATWPGRFEIMQEHPRIILDGAHNAHGIQALADSLGQDHNIHIIFAVLKDKNFEEMLEILQDITKDITICHFHNERALTTNEWKSHGQINICEDYQIAVKEAMQSEKTTVITGSLYFISEVRKFMKGLLNEME